MSEWIVRPQVIGARLGLDGRNQAAWRAVRLVVVSAVIAVVAWPITGSRPLSLDGSWQIGLHLAAQQGLRHGVEIVFTYGPLGFLGFAHPYVGMTSTLAFVAAIAIYMALICTMLLQASRILPFWAAALITLLVARIFVLLPPFEASLALACVWYVLALADRIPLPPPAFAAISGVMAGASMLGKVNVGIFFVALGLVTVAIVGRPLWRSLGAYTAATAATVLILWLATGQHVADLGAYASGVYQIIAGYNDAMGGDVEPKRTWIYLALTGASAIVVWAGWQSSQRLAAVKADWLGDPGACVRLRDAQDRCRARARHIRVRDRRCRDVRVRPASRASNVGGWRSRAAAGVRGVLVDGAQRRTWTWLRLRGRSPGKPETRSCQAGRTRPPPGRVASCRTASASGLRYWRQSRTTRCTSTPGWPPSPTRTRSSSGSRCRSSRRTRRIQHDLDRRDADLLRSERRSREDPPQFHSDTANGSPPDVDGTGAPAL